MLQKSNTKADVEPQRTKSALELFEPWKEEEDASGIVAATDVGLDEDGYQKLAWQRNSEQMEKFIRRAVKNLGLKVIDDEGLARLLPKYDGEEEIQSYAALEYDLVHGRPDEKQFVEPDPDVEVTVTGANATLDQPGYFAIAKLHNQEEMKVFVRRVADKMGLDIQNEGEFDGLVSWYSGIKGLQDIDSLESELKEISTRDGGWLLRRQ